MSAVADPPGDTGAARVAALVRELGVTTRTELVERSGLTRRVVDQRVGRLAELGLVIEDGLAESRGGRAPRALRFDASAGLVGVVEVGGSAVRAGLADLAGTLLAHRTLPIDLPAGPEAALDVAAAAVAALAAGHGGAGLWAIGVGMGGPVDAARGRTSAIPLLPRWAGIDVRGPLTGRFDVPVYVDNEVNAIALGEIAAGAAVGDTDLLYVNLDHGIGAGVVIDGRLCRGAAGAAGELAHVRVVDADPPPCWCGGAGCLVQVAGGAVLDGADVDAVLRAAELTGRALANVVAITNPAHVVVGGPTARRDHVVETIEATLRRYAMPAAVRDLRFSPAALPGTGGLVGAGVLALANLFSVPVLGQWVDDGSPRGAAGRIHRQPLA
ncbi:ROK family protein [Jiangella endophytica]|uniref:ROK family protein n=1 Tax=Jiangella endophytica TaxID=1623398 RepID=UPI000E348C0F|nr:ROK family protein [Jiangella endophytica]